MRIPAVDFGSDHSKVQWRNDDIASTEGLGLRCILFVALYRGMDSFRGVVSWGRHGMSFAMSQAAMDGDDLRFADHRPATTCFQGIPTTSRRVRSRRSLVILRSVYSSYCALNRLPVPVMGRLRRRSQERKGKPKMNHERNSRTYPSATNLSRLGRDNYALQRRTKNFSIRRPSVNLFNMHFQYLQDRFQINPSSIR